MTRPDDEQHAEPAEREPGQGHDPVEPAAGEPVAEQPVAEQPVAEEPVAERPVTEAPVTEEPVTEEPVAEAPVVDEPARDAVVLEKAPDEPVREPVVLEKGPEQVAPDPTPDVATQAETDPDDVTGTEVGADGHADDTDEAAADRSARRRRRPRRGLRRLVTPLGALGLVALLLLAAVVVLGLRERRAAALQDVERPNGPALTAAREAGRLLFSYDYRRLDQDFATALSLTTGSFTGEYKDFTEKVVKPVAAENQVVVTADVQQAGATAQTTPDRLVAIVFLDQSTSSKVVTEPAVDPSRVRMTLVHTQGRWLVSKVEAL